MKIQKTKKASLFGTPLIIFLSFIIMLVVVLIFYTFLSTQTTQKTFVIKNVQEEIGDNLFLIGILRSETGFEGKQVQLCELVARYKTEQDKKYETPIKAEINSLMEEMYHKKICWVMTISKVQTISESDSCQSLSREDRISAKTRIPGFDYESFEIAFETT